MISSHTPSDYSMKKRKNTIKGKKRQLSDVDYLYKEFNLRVEFPKSTVKELRGLSSKNTVGRRDLRGLNAVTIDPDEARDYDDALSVEILDQNKYRIGVHIADVAHWVREGGAIDSEARKRGNSNYFPWGSLPMLPESLTSDICSLVPDKDRNAVSCLFTIKAGVVQDYEIVESVIRSKRRLTYRHAQMLLDSNIDGEEEWLVSSLKILHQTAQSLRRTRQRKGGLTFHIPEYGAEVDKRNWPTKLFLREELESNRLVEDWMLEANTAVARYLHKQRLSLLYRNHAEPNGDNLEEFKSICKCIQISIKGKTPTDKYRNAMKELERSISGPVFLRLLLRTMPKALYEHQNHGHFGLGLDRYTHFTSPIRRYPDLIVHRILKKFLHKKDIATGKWKGEKSLVGVDLRWLGKYCTECEINSTKAERTAMKLMACKYMYGKENKKFMGTISGITNFGIFVELRNSPVEGLIPRRTLRSRRLDFEVDNLRVIGRDTQYTIGQQVEVKLKRSDRRKMQIDFELIK